MRWGGRTETNGGFRGSSGVASERKDARPQGQAGAIPLKETTFLAIDLA